MIIYIGALEWIMFGFLFKYNKHTLNEINEIYGSLEFNWTSEKLNSVLKKSIIHQLIMFY